MEESKCLCEKRTWALEARIRRMEQSLERVLEQLETDRPKNVNSRFSSSAKKTVILGQPGMTPVIPLHKAAEEGDVLALVRALYNGGDTTSTNQSGDTALHCAVRVGNTLAVELLLAAGAPVDAQDIRGITPLAVAARRGRHEIVEFLLEKGASIDRPDLDGHTPLMRAVALRNVGITACLVKMGASVNIVDHCGNSPLVVASRDSLTEILTLLMESKLFMAEMLQALSVAGSSDVFMILIKDAPPTALCSIKTACLPRVAKEGWERPVRALLASCVNVDCQSTHSEIICQAIATAGSECVLLALWSTMQMATRKIALKRAASSGWVVALKRMLCHWKMYPTMQDSDYVAEVDEALRVAGSEGAAIQLLTEWSSAAANSLANHDVLWRAVERGWSSVLLFLIKHGVAADVQRDGSTLLHCAAARGHVNCVKTLIKKGALTSQRDDDGWTPLHLAAEGGHEHVVQALLAAGADPLVKDPFGLTPRGVATSSIVGEMLRHREKSST